MKNTDVSVGPTSVSIHMVCDSVLEAKNRDIPYICIRGVTVRQKSQFSMYHGSTAQFELFSVQSRNKEKNKFFCVIKLKDLVAG